MASSVLRTAAAESEGFAADIASVGFLACVNPHVFLDIRGRAERRRTFSTLIGPLVRVDSSMRGEISSLSEGRRAQFASVGFLPAVNPLMNSQIVFASELHPTRFTCECFFTCVEQHVTREVVRLAKFR